MGRFWDWLQAAHFDNLTFVEGSDCKIAPKPPNHITPAGVGDLRSLESPPLSALERAKVSSSPVNPLAVQERFAWMRSSQPATREDAFIEDALVSSQEAQQRANELNATGKVGQFEYFIEREWISSRLAKELHLTTPQIQEWWESGLVGHEDFTPEQILSNDKASSLHHWIDVEAGVTR